MLNFTTNEASGVMILSFEATSEENYDWQVSPRDQLYQMIETREDGHFAIDLTEVNYLASSEIGFLITIKRRIDRRNGRVVLYGVSPYILDIFRTMNLQKVLDIVDNRSAALTRLRV